MQTVSVRRTVAVPIGDVFDWIADGRNWAKVPGMLYSRVQPADGPEPFGVGSTREFLSTGSKVREVVTAFERPRLISYQTLSTIPPAYHDGGTITFREVTGGTEIAWSTTFQLKSGENAEIAKAKKEFSDAIPSLDKAIELNPADEKAKEIKAACEKQVKAL